MTRRFATLAALVVVGLAGCSNGPPTPQPLRIAAASDLQLVMPVLLAAFQAEYDVKAEAAFAASGNLAAQIKAGAPFDVFLSANRAYVDDLAKAGVVRRDSVKPYARGTLAIAVNTLYDPGIKTLADLAGEKVKKIAIANPEVAPYGVAAKQALEKAGLWAKVEPKLVIAGDVHQAAVLVQAGEVDAAIVARSVAEVKGVQAVSIPDDVYAPVVQTMGFVAASTRGGDAEKFARFLQDDVARGILKRFGLFPPPEKS